MLSNKQISTIVNQTLAEGLEDNPYAWQWIKLPRAYQLIYTAVCKALQLQEAVKGDPMTKLLEGSTVFYKLSEEDIKHIESEFTDFKGTLPKAGDVLPLTISRIWSHEPATINGHVQLDGDQSYYVTSRSQGKDAGNWQRNAMDWQVGSVFDQS